MATDNDKSTKAIIGGINIEKLDSGCVVRIEIKTPDKNGYEGYRSTTKRYTAGDDLLEKILEHVDGTLEEDIEGDVEKEGVRLVNEKKFLTKTSKG